MDTVRIVKDHFGYVESGKVYYVLTFDDPIMNSKKKIRLIRLKNKKGLIFTFTERFLFF